jgi:hypothetical protein
MSYKCKRDQINKILIASEKLNRQVDFLQGKKETAGGQPARIRDTFSDSDLAELLQCQRDFQRVLLRVYDDYVARQAEVDDIKRTDLELRESAREARHLKLRENV